MEASFGLTLHNGYGLTEASPTISQTRIDDRHTSTTVGRVLPMLEYRLEPLQSADADAPETGELWIRGPNVMKGYFRQPEATRACLTEDGWLNTGDIARVDEHGELFIVGRSKELIIRSGFNIYPPDVEAVLNSHPLVTLSAVVGRQIPGNEGGGGLRPVCGWGRADRGGAGALRGRAAGALQAAVPDRAGGGVAGDGDWQDSQGEVAGAGAGDGQSSGAVEFGWLMPWRAELA